MPEKRMRKQRVRTESTKCTCVSLCMHVCVCPCVSVWCVSVYTSVSECLCVCACGFHPAKSICAGAAMDKADLPQGLQAALSPAGDPEMCPLPSECSQLRGEGDIEGVERGFLSLVLLPALPTADWKLPSPTGRPRPYPTAPSLGPGQGWQRPEPEAGRRRGLGLQVTQSSCWLSCRALRPGLDRAASRWTEAHPFSLMF